MDGLLSLHLFLLGIWAGIVAVESIFEGGALRGRFDEDTIVALHRWTDRLAEIPVLVGVVATGLLLWRRMGWDPSLLPKVGAGLGAVTANLFCVYLVERRASAAPEARWGFTRLTFIIGGAGVVSAVTALALGGRRAGWW